ITTALAAAAATKQPLTKRGVSRSVAFFTSSTAPEHAGHAAIPDTDTLVQYMGGREATATAQRMLAQGRRADTPVVVIENCSRPDQRIYRLTLATLAHGLGQSHGPVLVMLGEAMKRRDKQSADDMENEQAPRLTA
ncbi:MAG: SAM-dependent methyltransferase, partial [Telluria sp.]